MLAVDRVCVLAVDPAEPERMVVVEAQGVDDDVIGDRVPVDARLRAALCDGRPRLGPAPELFEPLGDGSGAATRIAGRAGTSGILYVACGDRARRFERNERALLRELATLFGAALEDVRLGAGLGAKMRACCDELARMAGDRALCATARRTGVRLGLDEAALIELEVAAHLFELQGPDAAARAVALMPGFEAVGLVLSLAGERPDGSGHPYGLEGDRIPVASRILGDAAMFTSAGSDGCQ